METAYLVKVDGNQNNNKFYKMTEIGNGMWRANYGRIGTEGQTHTYYDYEWDDKYWEKIRKGYRDQTSLLYESEVTAKSDNELLNKLIGYSQKFVKSYYISENITNTQIERAQELIHLLTEQNDVYGFNILLSEIFETVPRKMKCVREKLAKTKEDFQSILEREQSMLDSLKTRAPREVEGENISIEKLGLKIEEATDEEKSQVLRHIENSNKHRVKNIYRVENNATEERFNKFVKDNNYKEEDIHFWYHGSKNQNWYGIITEGQKLNPNAPITGKMFGYGLYYSPGKLQKSIGYTSLRDAYWTSNSEDVGYVGIYKVAMKNPKEVSTWNSELGSATQKTMDRYGCDGVYAHAGSALRNDETIVYREEQATIRYLLEIK